MLAGWTKSYSCPGYPGHRLATHLVLERPSEVQNIPKSHERRQWYHDYLRRSAFAGLERLQRKATRIYRSGDVVAVDVDPAAAADPVDETDLGEFGAVLPMMVVILEELYVIPNWWSPRFEDHP